MSNHTATLVPLELLPEFLRSPVGAALAEDRFDRAAQVIAAGVEGDVRDPAALVALALCQVEDARTGPFELLLDRSAAAQALLREARQRGAPPDLLSGARGRVRRAEAAERELRALEVAPAGTLDAASAARLRNRAYVQAERGGRAMQLSAARLWRVLHHNAAAAPAVPEWEVTNCFVRAGLGFANGGRYDLAQPYLDVIVDHGRTLVGLDWWQMTAAHVALTREAAALRDRARFAAWFWRGVAAAEVNPEGHRFFPYARPDQHAALVAALAFALPDVTRHLIGVFDAHRPARTIPPAIRAALAEARRLVAAAGGS